MVYDRILGTFTPSAEPPPSRMAWPRSIRRGSARSARSCPCRSSPQGCLHKSQGWTRRIPVPFLFTAGAHCRRRAQAGGGDRVGAADYLTRPFALPELLARRGISHADSDRRVTWSGDQRHDRENDEKRRRSAKHVRRRSTRKSWAACCRGG